ncbi:MAG TPA: hypothetical protein VHI77_05970 [Solirubrobacterales bacterium]|nr:hypothetical protein [Solirubrobacterales bacterium]
MSAAGSQTEPPFHLLLEQEEIGVAQTALNLLIADEARQGEIRRIAREVLAAIESAPREGSVSSVPLTPPQMKITHTAVRLLLDDLRREHAEERELLRGILDKLPDEHTMRAIELE